MRQPELFLLFTRPLDERGLAYLVTGSVASIIYGEPRITHDIDIVLDISARDAMTLVEAFPLDDFYCPPVEVVQIEARRAQRGHFNIIHHETGYKADIYLKGNHELQSWALDQRRPIALAAETLWVAPPEYVIVQKLEYYREGASEKHIRDILGMLALSGDEIDFEIVEGWVERLGLTAQWRRVLEQAP